MYCIFIIHFTNKIIYLLTTAFLQKYTENLLDMLTTYRLTEFNLRAIIKAFSFIIYFLLNSYRVSAHFKNRDYADIEDFLNSISGSKIEEEYQLWVIRGGDKIQVSGTIVPNASYDVFEKSEDLSSMQAKLFAKWSSQ